MKKQEQVIKEYDSGDEKKIIELFIKVFNLDSDIYRWKWQFQDHPKGKSWISLAQDGSEIVAQYCMMRHNLNFLGREITAGQSCDTMVRADQRGKQLFTKLAKRNYEFASKNGVQAVFGFPNRNSYPGLMNRLDWVRLFNLRYYYRRLGLKKILGNRMDILLQILLELKCKIECELRIKSKMNNFVVLTTQKLPKDLNEFLREINNYEVLSIWKDLEYLKWRYESHPQNKYDFHILKILDKTEALFVTKIKDETVSICEVLSRTKTILPSILLVYHVMIYSIKMKAQKIEFYGYDNGFFDSIFQSARFNKGVSPFIFGGKVFVDQKIAEMFKMPNNWSVSYGDTDVI